MENLNIVAALAALAQESRLAIFKLLVQVGSDGLAAGRISEITGIAPSSLSFHLKEMTHARMLKARQEGRFMIYSANYDSMNSLLAYLTENCCAGVPCNAVTGCIPNKGVGPMENDMSNKVFNVLILCTGNAARSIMAEAIFNSLPSKRFKAYSAGSNPIGHIHPEALRIVQTIGYPTESLRSKSWDEFAGPDAPHMDFIFTVCDDAAGQVCPLWPGQPITAHWSFEDPASYAGDAHEVHQHFLRVFHQIRHHIQLFDALPFATLDRTALQQEASNIARVVELA